MGSEPCRPVSVSMTIDAPADWLFAILADPAHHPSIDGSGMLREGAGTSISGIGDAFTMKMHNDEMGDYEMSNDIVGYEADRFIAWEPVLKSASRPEDEPEIGVKSGVRWSYRLQALDGRVTLVTETYDCSAAPEWLRRAVKNGERWVDSMTSSLARLNQLAQT